MQIIYNVLNKNLIVFFCFYHEVYWTIIIFNPRFIFGEFI